jgi:hypothetical protein
MIDLISNKVESAVPIGVICEICGETAFRFPALPGFSPSFL